jgi:hypothetical protein
MKEASYNALMSDMLVHNYGGRTIKIFNPTLLGLPDTFHFKDGIASFIEVKMGKEKDVVRQNGKLFCRPWAAVNDLRQYEVCRVMSYNATVIYMIYYPHIRWTAVIPMPIMEKLRGNYLLKEGNHFVKGHGLGVLVQILRVKRRMLYETLRRELTDETS